MSHESIRKQARALVGRDITISFKGDHNGQRERYTGFFHQEPSPTPEGIQPGYYVMEEGGRVRQIPLKFVQFIEAKEGGLAEVVMFDCYKEVEWRR
jgi:hypothetical protein